MDELSNNLQDNLKLVKENSDDPRKKLRSWLGQTLKIVITDNRIMVGSFICTDRDANIILENSSEYSEPNEGKYIIDT